MNFRELLTKLDEVDAAGLDQTTASAGTAPAAPIDPAKQHAYRRAQAAMANLEKAAQYTGTDEIVRQRAGLPPPLPPIAQWDGKMPQPVGRPDWLNRWFGKGGGLTGDVEQDQTQANAQNTADAAAIATAQAQLKQLNDLIAKISTAPVKEGTSYNLADQLMESFGYVYEDAPGFARTLNKGGWIPPALPTNNNAPTNTVSDFGSVGKARAERAAAAEAERLAAQKAAQTAATAAAPAATNAATHAAADAVTSAGKMAALKGGAKMVGKALPGVGLALSAKDAYDRAQKGDYTGAAMSGLAGVAGLVPGVGTAAALGLDAANIARDYKRGEFDDKTEPAAAATGSTTQQPPAGAKIKQMQDEILARNPKALPRYGADGKMGTETRTALAYFPDIAKKYGLAESVAESMSALKQKLAIIEAEQQADEGYSDWLKAGWQGAKALGTAASEFGGSAVKAAKATGGAGERLANTGANLTAAQKAGLKTGSAIAKHPYATAAGATAVGAGLGYGATKAPTNVPPAPQNVSTNRPPAQTPAAAEVNTTVPATQVAQIDPATMEEIQTLMANLAQVNDPEIQAGLDQARKAFNQLPGSQPKPVAADPAAAYGGSDSNQEQSGT